MLSHRVTRATPPLLDPGHVPQRSADIAQRDSAASPATMTAVTMPGPSTAVFQRALRACPGRDAGRGELPGPRVPRRRRHAALHPQRQGRVADRRRRQRVRRPRLLVGSDAARPRAPRGPGRGRGGGRARHVLRHAHRARGRARRGDRRPHAGREGAPGLVAAPRRPCRRSGSPAASPAATSWSSSPAATTATSTRCSPAPAPGLATLAVPGTPGVPASVDRRDDRAALQRPRGRRRGVRRARRPDRLPDHRGGARQHGRRPARSPASTASSPQTCRDHGALFISDEVMTGFRVTREGGWGLDGAVEGWTPRPDDLRQGDGRRLPGRGVRRSRRRDGAARARGPGLPGRHPVGEPDRDHRRPRHAAPGRRPTVYADLSATADTIKSAVDRGAHGRRCAPRRQAPGTMFSVFFRDGRSPTSPAPPAQDTAAFAAFFHAMLDAGVYLPPCAFESWFVSSAHDDRAVSAVLDALPGAARAAAATRATRRRR